jgi:putative transposase
MHTPASAHDGSWALVEASRAATLRAAYRAHPERFRRPPKPREMPARAWINKPAESLQNTQAA